MTADEPDLFAAPEPSRAPRSASPTAGSSASSAATAATAPVPPPPARPASHGPTAGAAAAPAVPLVPAGTGGRSGPPSHEVFPAGPQQPAPAPASAAPRARLGAGPVALVLALALVAGFAGGYAGDRVARSTAGPAPVANLPVAADDDAADPSRPAGSVAAIAADVLPSVVSFEVTASDGSGSSGSGFVLREDGYLLTNNHVVAAGAEGGEIVVVLADGSEHDGEVVGRTSDYDLAVVRIDVDGLTPLVLGDSDDVVVGDAVLAVGAPLGLDSTVTSGIVSALHRPVQAGDQATTAFIDAIQTDAAINPGNSGGPLVDADGEVVGINSAIAQPPGALQATGSIGLGFAIPANQARTTAEQLIETGSATYPVIGVLLDSGYSGVGVKVADDAQEGVAPVTPDGPADLAGVRPGDLILEIDGRPVSQSDELIVAIRARQPGDAVTLTVRTGEETREVRVVLQESQSD
ncbi:putative serine protease PepD [Isoptericola jiangsuensis]|uniref:Putative serine protease PepD n=1 Tax=Isoptericola jiangsuensis TaxID=548579 RepID=A0A2A9EW36_9MICO|nr:trypsin-like peptidase domain-containing protein [Isoptericola jiangsuensis]PFG42502.1 putative serine protease PepD [Isoptericola jiangsuensis]